MAKVSPLMIAPPLIFAAFVVLAFVGMYRDDPEGLPSTMIGRPAPDIPEQGLSDFAPVTSEMLATGEVTLVNFWASWCPPCRAEHPKLLEMQADGINIIGINFKDTESAATKYLIDDGTPFAGVAFDPKGRTAIDWGSPRRPRHSFWTGRALFCSVLQAHWLAAITSSAFCQPLGPHKATKACNRLIL